MDVESNSGIIKTAKRSGRCIYCTKPILPGQKRRQVQEGGGFASSHVQCYTKHLAKVIGPKGGEAKK